VSEIACNFSVNISTATQRLCYSVTTGSAEDPWDLYGCKNFTRVLVLIGWQMMTLSNETF
jgi:hypothetical protein